MTKKKIDLVEEEGFGIEEETSAESTEVIEEVTIEEIKKEPEPLSSQSKAYYYKNLIGGN